jgi:hypothetical protein
MLAAGHGGAGWIVAFPRLSLLDIDRNCGAGSADWVDAGNFDSGQAMHLARLWFHDNPARIYRLAT